VYCGQFSVQDSVLTGKLLTYVALRKCGCIGLLTIGSGIVLHCNQGAQTLRAKAGRVAIADIASDIR
jgi:hypothetical protein